MRQSTSPIPTTLPSHVAIIMDGNGRWAVRRGRSRTAGHLAGARAVRRCVEAAAQCGIATLTLYAFSADNWQRPTPEVDALMALFRRYLASETARCVANGIRMRVIGRRDRLPGVLVRAIDHSERVTADGSGMLLRIALDYSSRDAIAAAAERLSSLGVRDVTRATFERALGDAIHAGAPSEPVDLLIRTGGEQRLSDFMLWECAYAELVFTDVLWPNFSTSDLRAALADFAVRERRFGALPVRATG